MAHRSTRCQSEMLLRVVQQVCQAWPPANWVDSESLVAVSGGPDSVGLLRVLLQIQQQTGGSGKLQIVHCNHQIGEQSDRHAEFVNDLATQLNLPCHCINRSDLARSEAATANSEQALREIRYAAMFQVAAQTGARNIVTGHTADDQIETVLFRLFRGTGLSGLQGIPIVRVQHGCSIVRPLLTTRRNDIIELLSELNQPWQTDQTNLNSDYARNFLRNEIIPLIALRFGEQYANSIIRLGQQAREYEGLLDRLTDAHVPPARMEPDRIEIPTAGIAELDAILQRHVLKRLWRTGGFPEQAMTQSSWSRVAQMLTSEEGSTVHLPGRVQAVRQQGQLVISRVVDR